MGYLLADLFVEDVEKSIAYYVDVLGFELKGKESAEGVGVFWGWVALGDGQIMFGSRESAYKGTYAKPVEFRQGLENNQWGIGVSLHFRDATPDLDAYYEQVKGRGARIVDELRTTPYGWRLFTVQDLDGYRLGFSVDAPQ